MNNRFQKTITAIGLKNKDLAKELGITPAAVSDIANGRVKKISGSLLIILEMKYNINPHWLLTGEGEMFITPKPIDENVPRIINIEQLIQTEWFKNLSAEEKNIITSLGSIMDKAILKKISDLMISQVLKEKADNGILQGLNELENDLKNKRKQ